MTYPYYPQPRWQRPPVKMSAAEVVTWVFLLAISMGLLTPALIRRRNYLRSRVVPVYGPPGFTG